MGAVDTALIPIDGYGPGAMWNTETGEVTGGTTTPKPGVGFKTYTTPVEEYKGLRSYTGLQQIGPFFEDSGMRARVDLTGNPFGLTTQYEVDWEAVKQWAMDHAFALSGASFLASMSFLAIQEPERYVELIKAGGQVFGLTLTGVGNIFKGIGEMIPG